MQLRPSARRHPRAPVAVAACRRALPLGLLAFCAACGRASEQAPAAGEPAAVPPETAHAPSTEPPPPPPPTPGPPRNGAPTRRPAMANGGEEIARFPWPPPRPSDLVRIPSELVTGGRAEVRLGEAAGRLERAFTDAGYGRLGYYSAPDGFVLVSRMEQIRDDGTPRELPVRWSADIAPPRLFGLSDYLRALFSANPGRYRVIAFVVTTRAIRPDAEPATREQAAEWLDAGADALPAPLAAQSYTPAHRTTALVYEFVRPSSRVAAEQVRPSRTLARTHLERAGLWAALEAPR